jgi:acetyltransferase-like isoleucine patch superfamily enzyme
MLQAKHIFRFYYKLKSLLSGGAFRIGRKAKIRYFTHFRWRKGGGIVIGRYFSAESGVVVDAQSGSIRIGDNVSLNDHVVLLGHGDITIDDDVRIATHVVLASFDHNFAERHEAIRNQGITKKPIVIGRDVWIGAGAKILGGSTIAAGCVIGANAVLKGSTVPYGVYVGNPARLLKVRGQHERLIA